MPDIPLAASPERYQNEDSSEVSQLTISGLFGEYAGDSDEACGVGAGGRGEGLYEGGGARVLEVSDLNADGVPEIAFFVGSLGELYLAEWNDAEFSSLVERVDELGFPSSYIPVQDGAFEFTDVDDDGALEVRLSDPPGLWRWDGSLYQPAPE